MELLLWRWSMAVQVTSLLMVAVFFTALDRSVRRPELRRWLYAWLADFGALALALGFWYFRPDPRYDHLVFTAYLGAKTAFVLLLLQGAWILQDKSGWLLRNNLAFPLVALFSIAGGFLSPDTDHLGLIAYPVMSIMFLAGAVPLIRPFSSDTAWLAAGFITRAVLLFGETGAYIVRMMPSSTPNLQAPLRLFISAASSFDSGAEWLIALGCVLAVSNRIQRELRESNSELLAAQALAEEANLSKSVFLANMSHELRTPLNAVIGFAQLMARSQSLATEDRENVAIIRRSGEHLLGLINEVLSISKIEAGRLTVERRPFDPRELVLAVASMVRGRATAAQLDLIVDLDPAFPPTVSGEEGKLRQALLNLMGNAVKFTSSGSVTLRARWSSERATFEVIDTGYGIAENELPSLFEPFVQTESGRHAREGTGLGLAITRQLVQLMGGEITVASQLGKGTSIRVELRLPVDTSPIEQVNVHRVIGLEGNEQSRRILVVDDTPEGRILLRKLLESVGLEVSEAADGAEALDEWRRWKPDLILMDNRMPVIDGSEATETIRRLEANLGRKRTVIVAVTASVFEHERGNILARGADEVVMKPFREEKIFEILSSHLGVRFRREHEAPHGNRVLLVDDDGISRRVAFEQLGRLGLDVTEATGGAEALKILEGFPFDAVLLDLEMPQPDGRATLQAIRAQQRLRALPVILLTAHDSEEAQVEGMTGYLSKPLDEAAVTTLLGRYLSLTPIVADQTPAAGESNTTLNVMKGLRYASGNTVLYEKVLRMFRNSYSDVLSQMDRSDDDTSRLLHSLRGSAATIGADSLATETAKLESSLQQGEPLALDSFARILDETMVSIDARLA